MLWVSCDWLEAGLMVVFVLVVGVWIAVVAVLRLFGGLVVWWPCILGLVVQFLGLGLGFCRSFGWVGGSWLGAWVA